jgi:hypothetical protein
MEHEENFGELYSFYREARTYHLRRVRERV